MNAVANDRESIIIVGGGVAGLSSALLLLKQDYNVTILEGSERLGGRIHTIRDSGFLQPVEKGVEFIHGNLPLTMELLQEAEIEYKPVGGMMIRIAEGQWKTQDDFTVGWKELMEQMNELREDMSLEKFLDRSFRDEKYAELRKSVLRFAQGFDLADPAKASVLSLREEWMGEQDEQFRIPGGCDQLIDYLELQCHKFGGIVHCSSKVSEVQWEKNKVTLTTTEGKIYNANKIIVTASLGTLVTDPPVIDFQPSISEYMNAAKRIGYGSVVKVILQFRKSFWEQKKKNLGFLFTDEMIPTWWTQAPSNYPLLTGWAGGPQAWELEEKDDQSILQVALQSLSNIFQIPVDELNQLLTASLVANWAKNDFSRGAYSYSMVGSTQAQKLFSNPIDNTIFFAGEAFYDGPSPGTVEAALVSARNVAQTAVGRA